MITEFALIVGKAPWKFRGFRFIFRSPFDSQCQSASSVMTYPAPMRQPIPGGKDFRSRDDRRKGAEEISRLSFHIQKPVHLPMAIRQFLHDVSRQRRLPPHGLNLIAQRPELLPLGLLD